MGWRVGDSPSKKCHKYLLGIFNQDHCPQAGHKSNELLTLLHFQSDSYCAEYVGPEPFRQDIIRHGPLVGVTTEIFECFNTIFSEDAGKRSGDWKQPRPFITKVRGDNTFLTTWVRM